MDLSSTISFLKKKKKKEKCLHITKNIFDKPKSDAEDEEKKKERCVVFESRLVVSREDEETVDCQLPIMSGSSTTTTIRQNKRETENERLLHKLFLLLLLLRFFFFSFSRFLDGCRLIPNGFRSSFFFFLFFFLNI